MCKKCFSENYGCDQDLMKEIEEKLKQIEKKDSETPKDYWDELVRMFGG